MTDRELMQQALEALETNQYAVADAAPHRDVMAYNDVITALRERLAQQVQEPPCKTGASCVGGKCPQCEVQQEQEPVAGEPLPCPFCGANDGLTMTDGSTYRWGYAYCSNCGASAGETRRAYPDDGKWYQEAIQRWNQRATPPRREWQGLTEEDIDGVKHTFDWASPWTLADYARAIEAKLKEKNA